jgi:serine protease Do
MREKGRKHILAGSLTFAALAAFGTVRAVRPLGIARASAPPSPAKINEARTIGHVFAQIAQQVSPSVVKISVTKTGKGGLSGNPFRGNPFKGTPFERFFGDGDDQGDDDQGTAHVEHGLGSGVVIDGNGDILTNAHVVEHASKVEVGFVDGQNVKGKVLGTDPKSDLAVVKVDGVRVKPAALGDSDQMQVGEWVIAIGNPFGLEHTVTVGVLSAKNRSGFTSGHYEDFLQTDASINPGNSGGPLVNVDGQVIGINTMIAGLGTGVGFAVPSAMAKPIADQLIHTGKVKRPFVGIAMQDMTSELAKAMGAGAPAKGALVSEVTPGSPADKAGIKAGDVIVSVNGQGISGSQAVQRQVLTQKIGTPVKIDLWRAGKQIQVAATTVELPQGRAEENHAAPKEKLGLQLQTLTPPVADELGLSEKTKGAVVSAVKSGSIADDAGVKTGDVVVQVDGKVVASASDAIQALGLDHPGGHLLRVRRGDAAVFIPLPQGEG